MRKSGLCLEEMRLTDRGRNKLDVPVLFFLFFWLMEPWRLGDRSCCPGFRNMHNGTPNTVELIEHLTRKLVSWHSLRMLSKSLLNEI